MSRERHIQNRVNELLEGSGVVQKRPSFFSGNGVVQKGPSYFSGNGVVIPGPAFYSGGKRKKQNLQICQHCEGTGFFDDLWSGIKSVGSAVGNTVLPMLSMLAKAAMGVGKPKREPSKRNLLIKELILKKGMTLPEASAFIKSHGCL